MGREAAEQKQNQASIIIQSRCRRRQAERAMARKRHEKREAAEQEQNQASIIIQSRCRCRQAERVMERTRHEKREAEQQKAMCEADAQQAAQDQPTSEPTAGIRPLQGHSTAQVGIAQEPLAEAPATTGIDSAVAELDVDDVLAFAAVIANGSADSDGDG